MSCNDTSSDSGQKRNLIRRQHSNNNYKQCSPPQTGSEEAMDIQRILPFAKQSIYYLYVNFFETQHAYESQLTGDVVKFLDHYNECMKRYADIFLTFSRDTETNLGHPVVTNASDIPNLLRAHQVTFRRTFKLIYKECGSIMIRDINQLLFRKPHITNAAQHMLPYGNEFIYANPLLDALSRIFGQLVLNGRHSMEVLNAGTIRFYKIPIFGLRFINYCSLIYHEYTSLYSNNSEDNDWTMYFLSLFNENYLQPELTDNVLLFFGDLGLNFNGGNGLMAQRLHPAASAEFATKSVYPFQQMYVCELQVPGVTADTASISENRTAAEMLNAIIMLDCMQNSAVFTIQACIDMPNDYLVLSHAWNAIKRVGVKAKGARRSVEDVMVEYGSRYRENSDGQICYIHYMRESPIKINHFLMELAEKRICNISHSIIQFGEYNRHSLSAAAAASSSEGGASDEFINAFAKTRISDITARKERDSSSAKQPPLHMKNSPLTAMKHSVIVVETKNKYYSYLAYANKWKHITGRYTPQTMGDLRTQNPHRLYGGGESLSPSSALCENYLNKIEKYYRDTAVTTALVHEPFILTAASEESDHVNSIRTFVDNIRRVSIYSWLQNIVGLITFDNYRVWYGVDHSAYRGGYTRKTLELQSLPTRLIVSDDVGVLKQVIQQFGFTYESEELLWWNDTHDTLYVMKIRLRRPSVRTPPLTLYCVMKKTQTAFGSRLHAINTVPQATKQQDLIRLRARLYGSDEKKISLGTKIELVNYLTYYITSDARSSGSGVRGAPESVFGEPQDGATRV